MLIKLLNSLLVLIRLRVTVPLDVHEVQKGCVPC